MSNARFSILQARAVKDTRVSDSQFRTLAALGMYADQDGWCYPSLTTLGVDLGKSKQAVGRDTIALRKIGYLEVTPRFAENGARRSSLYRLKFDLPRQRQVDTPSTNQVDTPSTSEVDVNVPVNDPRNNGAKAPKSSKTKKPDILDGIIHYHLKPKAIQDAIRDHFRLTPNWEAKYNRQFMQWAVEENITPEQIKAAAELWRTDKRFNWSVPTLKGIHEHWLELTEVESSVEEYHPEFEIVKAEPVTRTPRPAHIPRPNIPSLRGSK